MASIEEVLPRPVALAEAAAWAGVGEEKMRAWAESGEVPAQEVGGELFFSAAELDRLFNGGGPAKKAAGGRAAAEKAVVGVTLSAATMAGLRGEAYSRHMAASAVAAQALTSWVEAFGPSLDLELGDGALPADGSPRSVLNVVVTPSCKEMLWELSHCRGDSTSTLVRQILDAFVADPEGFDEVVGEGVERMRGPMGPGGGEGDVEVAPGRFLFVM